MSYRTRRAARAVVYVLCALLALPPGFGTEVLMAASRTSTMTRDATMETFRNPQFTSGTRRDESVLLRAIPGAVGKAGAESCYAVALRDGRAVALKTDDGAARVRPVLMAAALERLGVPAEPGVDGEAVRRTGVVDLLGGGIPVGSLRAVF